MRLGVVTHTINNDGRRVPLSISSQSSSTTYSLQVPDNANVVLPGLYWLFALTLDGVPSDGWNVEISA